MKAFKMRKIPLHSMVLLIGPVGPSKSNLIKDKFDSYEVISNDKVRISLVGDKFRHDVNSIVEEEIVRQIDLKIRIGERVVIDSSNLTARERSKYTKIADKYGIPIYYIVIGKSAEEIEYQKKFPPSDYVKKNDQFFLDNEASILHGDYKAAVIDTRVVDFTVIKKFDNFDILDQITNRDFHGITVAGDVHGNLESLKNCVDWAQSRRCLLLQLGDIVDYGPKPIDCVNLLYDKVTRGQAIMVIGNHENKIERWIKNERAKMLNPDLAFSKRGPILSDANKATTNQIESMSEKDRIKFEARFAALINLARNHWVIGDYLFTHGAADIPMWKMTGSRLTSKLEHMSLYGEVEKSGNRTEERYPKRLYNWVDRIPQYKTVVVGHDIRDTGKPKVVHGVRGGTAIFMDTGSSKGGHLSSADIIIRRRKMTLQNFNWQ